MLWANWSNERVLWNQGYSCVAGIDEVGRGSWAGPVVAAAVVFPSNYKSSFKLADSKLLKPIEREELDQLIRSAAQSIAIGEVGLPVINKEGIGKASQRAFRLALNGLSTKPDYYLVDAFYIKYIPKRIQRPIIKGDQISASIAAASIVAKVYRDNLMRQLAKDYPEYGFGKHKGYGTTHHQKAIKDFGFSPIHRSSFDLTFLNLE
jgi:ribonuclease HII